MLLSEVGRAEPWLASESSNTSGKSHQHFQSMIGCHVMIVGVSALARMGDPGCIAGSHRG